MVKKHIEDMELMVRILKLFFDPEKTNEPVLSTYGVVQSFENRSLKHSRVKKLLDHLSKKGLLEKLPADGRNYYRMTDKGRRGYLELRDAFHLISDEN